MKELILRSGKVALVSDTDFDWLQNWKWTTNQKGYVGRQRTLRGNGQKWLLLSRFIVGEPIGMQVDHINHNILDNRRENLRICTPQENNWNSRKPKNNSSGFKGVIFRKDPLCPRMGKFRARITVHGKRISLGDFMSAEDAARAYDNAAKKYFGDYACLNFPKN